MGRKVILAFITYSLIVSFTLGFLSIFALKNTLENLVKKHLEQTTILANTLDFILQKNLNRLYDISLSSVVNFNNNIKEEVQALKEAYNYSIFNEGILLLDNKGKIKMSYPEVSYYIKDINFNSYLKDVSSFKKPLITQVIHTAKLRKDLILVMLPYRDARGKFSGILCGIIYFYNTQINEFLKSNTTIIKNNLLYLLDTSGNILQKPFVQDKMLSTTTLINTLKKNLNKNTSGTFKAKNSFSHICSYASLQYAPWIVLSCQDSTIVYAPIKYLVNLFIIITILYILTGLIFATGLSKGIIAPVRALIDETKNIAAGNLSKALVIRGGYEIEELAESFENMRKKLKTSIEHIQSYNEQLEDMVSERTKEVEKNRKKIESLLGLIMTSQEEERKRIARELHDEPLQNLSVILMQLTQFKQLKNKPTDDQINNLLNLLLKINHDIRLIIQNLRPTVLDDLGLISAIRWILENHLRPYNIDYYFDYDNNLEDVRFNSIIEINIYRIIQEAVSNICKHSQAQNVHIKFIVKKQKIIINIIDNGIGFDVNKVLNKDVSIKTDLKGIGLLGMYERVALLDGNITINSTLNKGTEITITIPLEGGKYHE